MISEDHVTLKTCSVSAVYKIYSSGLINSWVMNDARAANDDYFDNRLVG